MRAAALGAAGLTPVAIGAWRGARARPWSGRAGGDPRVGAQPTVSVRALPARRGSTVDFEDDMMKSSFVSADVALSRLATPGSTGTNRCLWPVQVIFGNPQSEAGCGCGASFAPKD